MTNGGGGVFRVYNAESLGRAVRHFRREAGLTQAELAAAAGLHRSYLAELEGGRMTEQVERLVRVLAQLGVRITLRPEQW